MQKEIRPAEISANAFSMIGEKWLLVAARKDDGAENAMTASWGGVGVMWGHDAAFVFIRPQRYTDEFVKEGEFFSLSVFDDPGHKLMSYMGSVSGRDEDKLAHCGLSDMGSDDAPHFSSAKITLICKKLYAQRLDPACFTDGGKTDARWYPAKDYHTMYVAEITKAYEGE